jgi:hypothetical protein
VDAGERLSAALALQFTAPGYPEGLEQIERLALEVLPELGR